MKRTIIMFAIAVAVASKAHAEPSEREQLDALRKALLWELELRRDFGYEMGQNIEGERDAVNEDTGVFIKTAHAPYPFDSLIAIYAGNRSVQHNGIRHGRGERFLLRA